MESGEQTLREVASILADTCHLTRVRRLSRQITRIYDDELRPFGLRGAQHAILIALATHERLNVMQLASALDLEKSAVSRTVTKLESRGWVEAVPGTDQRVRWLTLSATGEELFRAVLPAWERAQARASSLLTP